LSEGALKEKMKGIGLAAACCLILATACTVSKNKPVASSSWLPKAAAQYLDYRESWWTGWNGAARDHGTFCISCHTALPYALARPALRPVLAEQGPSANEIKLLDNVTKRVRLWNEVGPYYNDPGYGAKASESRGTEAVLNALILASYDSERGQLGADTRTALRNMWAFQQTSGEKAGAWPWLQFDQEPWEANGSAYYGACLAAIAVGISPGNYAASPEAQGGLKLLRDYLNRDSAAQSTINRVFLLWASTKLAGLLNQEQQNAIIEEVLSRQQPDGGWRLASIAWRWRGWSVKSLLRMWLLGDGTPLARQSDGVATGLVTFVLEEAGVPRENIQLRRGLSWLMSNQNTAEGFWPASSINKRKSLTSDTGRFMSDAATAYAVLALTAQKGSAGSVAAVASY
jgi:squalene-hopene/tetraprenyl-beta-curcumene cyclase